MKDKKILHKIDKLLKAYGVEDDKERENFLKDVQDSKYDEEEIVEETNEEEQPQVEEPIEEENNEKVEETTETEEKEEVEEPTDNLPIDNEEPKQEEIVEEQVETETPNEEVVEEDEEVVEEPVQPELPNEQPLMEEPQEPDAVETFKGQLDEMKKSNEGLVARLEQVETILSKLGVPTEEQFGESPMSQKGLEDNSDMAEINRKRLGY